MIEKKLHYIWVGGNPKPDILNICILNWKEKLPDYEIIEWNEKNFDLDQEMRKNKFLRECYERKLWAFVSDYMRVKILYEQGGIYIDTDMLLLKSITPLLNNKFFIAYENERYISVGIFGCKSKDKFLKKVLEFYEKNIWYENIWTIPKIFTYVLDKNPILKKEITIYPKEYFYPYYYNENFSEEKLTQNTYGIHWWGKNWGNEKEIAFLETKHLDGMKKIFKLLKIRLRNYRIVRKIYKWIKGEKNEVFFNNGDSRKGR